ncbi:ATP synthase F1 subunit delta [Acidipila sp. EB88]|uniref:ATP synthase F1 subunit delta n=1 Tax=Acidipila sp. EB88 TaxID=2305226 RepID=UPI000F5E147B|nr:ATP synthase F1 subunit delta [Acidipila sp. EB88]RRA48573.1 ATP synthase F1 subunit delta [Acidipila sp. EB88]
MATVYAARYARALLDVVETNKIDPEAAGRELADLLDAWSESAALRNVFLDPSYAADKKISLLDKLNERLHMQKTLRNFIAVILRHERMEAFPEIVSEYDRMVRGDLKIARVEWTSARALSTEERGAIEQRIAELTGTRVEATFREDPALLGGARLQIGSVVYDGTVRGRLDQLKERLAS